MDEKQRWKAYGFVVRSKQRRAVLGVMEGPMTVTEIKKETNLSLSETSRILRGLREKDLAKCINPEEPTGRVYKLTEKGETIRREIRHKQGGKNAA